MDRPGTSKGMPVDKGHIRRYCSRPPQHAGNGRAQSALHTKCREQSAQLEVTPTQLPVTHSWWTVQCFSTAEGCHVHADCADQQSYLEPVAVRRLMQAPRPC